MCWNKECVVYLFTALNVIDISFTVCFNNHGQVDSNYEVLTQERLHIIHNIKGLSPGYCIYHNAL